jgi:hypothetical protein
LRPSKFSAGRFISCSAEFPFFVRIPRRVHRTSIGTAETLLLLRARRQSKLGLIVVET